MHKSELRNNLFWFHVEGNTLEMKYIKLQNEASSILLSFPQIDMWEGDL